MRLLTVAKLLGMLMLGLKGIDLTKDMVPFYSDIVRRNDVADINEALNQNNFIREMKVTKKLGQGSFGIVFEVEDASNHYALKLTNQKNS